MMALTLDKEQKLQSVSLIDFYNIDQTPWRELAKKSYGYVHGNFPADSPLRRDDVEVVPLPKTAG
jgi:hypothetical protein